MNQLITITQNENKDQVVSGRELHEFLVSQNYLIIFGLKEWQNMDLLKTLDFIGFEQKSYKLRRSSKC